MGPRIPSEETVVTFLIVTTVFNGIAVLLTIFRLYFRYSIRRLWWDDLWAALAMCCNCVSVISSWLIPTPTHHVDGTALKPQSRTTHIVAFWLAILFYTCTIWFARLSIMSSLIRIVPPSRSIRLATLGSSCILALMWLYTLLAKTLACAIDTSWYHAGAPQCPIPEWVAISEVIADSLSDIMLVSVPLRLLWRVRLPSNQRIMIMAVFSASILTTVVSIVHTAYVIPPSFIGGMTAQIESMVSLVVCNLLVLVTFIYRTTHDGRDLTASMKATGTSHRLTSIELYISGATESCHVSTNTEMRDTDTEGASATLASTGITSGANTGIGRSHCGGHSGPSLLASDVKSYSTELGTDSG